MKFYIGDMPKWKSKPKVSPLDSDAEFQKLCSIITSGSLKPFQTTGLYINSDSDAKRLKTKNPARLVHDRLRRFLKELHLEADYTVTRRQTADPGVWGVVVKMTPREADQTAKAAARKKS